MGVSLSGTQKFWNFVCCMSSYEFYTALPQGSSHGQILPTSLLQSSQFKQNKPMWAWVAATTAVAHNRLTTFFQCKSKLLPHATLHLLISITKFLLSQLAPPRTHWFTSGPFSTHWCITNLVLVVLLLFLLFISYIISYNGVCVPIPFHIH